MTDAEHVNKQTTTAKIDCFDNISAQCTHGLFGVFNGYYIFNQSLRDKKLTMLRFYYSWLTTCVIQWVSFNSVHHQAHS